MKTKQIFIRPYMALLVDDTKSEKEQIKQICDTLALISKTINDLKLPSNPLINATSFDIEDDEG